MRFCLQHRAVLLQWGILDIALSLFTVEKSLRWASRVMLINSPLTRLWLAYWFSLQTSLPLQKLSCMITFLWHRQPQMQICFDWPAFEQWRSRNISHSTLYPQWHWHIDTAFLILWTSHRVLLLWFVCALQTEEEVSVGGYCQPRFLPDSGASLAPQQGCTTCCQDNRRPRRAGKQHYQLPARQPPVWRAEERLHHR